MSTRWLPYLIRQGNPSDKWRCFRYTSDSRFMLHPVSHRKMLNPWNVRLGMCPLVST